MKGNRTGLRAWLRAALAGVLSQWHVAANPSHPVVTQGSASFSTQGPQLTIHTGNDALINWSSFNIGAGETTTFVQPSATSVVWNHISDPNPTQILGHLDANGYVVLQNQSGFYIGGNAVVNAAGLLMTTTPAVPVDVFGGGSWSFTAPPPTASIINYGEINAGPAGSVFLISHDIQNNGVITAPGGNIGLCAGEQVLMSTRADGRGLSATVTLPEGSVNNSGKLIADAGTIALNAQVVNQGGLIQANSVRNQDGVIEIVASDSVNLGEGSTISAKGDTQGPSAGGQVTIKSGNTFSDTVSSVIDVSGGTQGGNGGQVEISAAQISSIQSHIDGLADQGWVGGRMTIDPANIVIAASGPGTTDNGTVTEGSNPGSTLVLSTTYLNGFSQIDLQASANITLTSPWTVPASATAATLTLQAGNNIIFAGSGDTLTAGQNWSVNLIAGANFNTLTGVTPNSTAGSSSIIMSGNAGVQSANGSINLIAGGGIVTGTGSVVSTGGGSILMQAMSQNIVLGGTQWTLPDSPSPASLTLQSGSGIVFSGSDNVTLGQNWSVNMISGANFNTPTGVTPNSTAGAGSIVMSGGTSVQTANGSIDLIAGGGIVTGTGSIVSTGGGSILLQAVGQNLVLGGAQWNLPDSATPATLNLQSGDNIIFGGSGGDILTLGQDWNVNMISGANFTNPNHVTATPNSTTGDSSIIMSGNTGVQTANGSVNLIAGNGIVTTTGTIESTEGGSILMQAVGQNLVLGGKQWTLPDSATPASLTLQAANNIIFSGSDDITLGQNWNVNMVAGANFNTPTSATPNSFSGQSQIVLGGNTGVQTANGNINLIAGNSIITGTGSLFSTGGGSILMQALAQNLVFGGSQWSLPDSATPASLTLQAGNNIIFSGSDILTLGQNWSVNMVAGANFNTPTSVTPNSTSGESSIIMSGNTGVQSANGRINLIAGDSIVTTSGTIETTGGGPILLQAVSQNIVLGNREWNLPDNVTPASVTLQAGDNIVMGGGIEAGQNWALNLVAGSTFASPTSVNTQNTGSVVLGSAVLQTQNGNINVTAASGVSATSGSITTMNGGNINVDAVGGDVNTGSNPNGYAFRTGGVSSLLGGFSTAAGGNVSITAGGNITSYLPTGTSSTPTDAGSGAFGPEPGVVTITAGGSVFGHYVAADSEANGLVVPSTITAETGDAGSSGNVSEYLALSLVTGSWVVNAPKGSINLQEVRNPDGNLDAVGIAAMAAQNNVFNYAPDASVTLNGNAVNLLGTSLPRDSGFLVPCIYPPILTINAGPGGVSLDNNVTLFPSPEGELTVNTTVPSGTALNAPGTPPPGSFNGNGFTLSMSDSSATRWIGPGQAGSTDFASDHGATPIQLNNNQPVVFNIAGDLDDVTIVSPKETQVTVGGNMDNVSFTGQNLHSSDVTFFNVAGKIYDQNTYAFVSLGASLPLPAPLYPGATPIYLQLLENAVVPGSGPNSANAGSLFPNLFLFYLPGTQQLGYYGIMTPAVEALLLGSLQEKTYTPAGKVILDAQGNYVTTTVSFAADSGSTQPLYQAIQALYSASQNSIVSSAAPQGIIIGGPGQLDITAQSMDLGASEDGISSVGPAFNSALAKIATQGASIKIDLTGDLDMFASQISSWYGGAININVGGSIDAGLANLPFQQSLTPHGIWTSDDSDISVIAQGNIDIDGSRIATYDGGNINVESVQGNVDAGSGSLNAILVNEVLVNPTTGAVTTPTQQMAGSGILATTLPGAPGSLEVGNITVNTPQGNIDASLGGITQEPKNGNSSLTPTVNLTAGGNIDASGTGVIAINVNAQASGSISGLFISSGNSTIHSDTSIDATILAGGTATLSAGTTISGLAIAGGGINIGSGSFQGVALSQSVSGGGAQSALASAASASAGSQTSAAGEASSQKSETSDQSASSNTGDDLNRARGRPLLAKYFGRVTVLLPPNQNTNIMRLPIFQH
jgi:filamentous hemagglutinin family protein